MSNVPVRIRILESEVKVSPEWSHWRADYSPESLKTLGRWLAATIVMKNEPKVVSDKHGNVLAIENQLSTETRTRCFDAGMYFGEVLVRNNPELKWELSGTKDKRNADYAQVLVKGRHFVPCNPVEMAVAFAITVAKGDRTDAYLHEVYGKWVKILVFGPTPMKT